MQAYSNPNDVVHDRDPLLSKYQKAEAQYGYPRGARALDAALKSTWGHIWDYAYWWNAQVHDPVDKWGVDGEQQYGAVAAAQISMQEAWSDVRATC